MGVITEFLERKIPSDWYKRDLSARRTYWSMGAKDKEGLVEREHICAAEIWCECFNGDLKHMRRADAIEINNILASVQGWKRHEKAIRFGAVYGVQKGYVRTEKLL